MKETLKTGLKKAGITLGVVSVGFTAYATNDTVKKYTNELRADLKDKSELVYEVAEKNVFEVLNIEKTDIVEKKEDEEDNVNETNPEENNNTEANEGGDGGPKSGKHFSVDKNGNILTYVQEGTEEAKKSSYVIDNDEMQAYLDLPNNDPEKAKAIVVFRLLNNAGLTFDQKDEIISNFVRLLSNKTTPNFNEDNIFACENSLDRQGYTGKIKEGVATFIEAMKDFFTTAQVTKATKTKEEEKPLTEHEKKLANNPIYKANYEHANKLVSADAGSICAKIGASQRLNQNQQKALLMVTFDDYYKDPKSWKDSNVRALLGIYYDDISWGNETKSPKKQIREAFGELRGIYDKDMATKDMTSVPVPVYVSEESKKIAKKEEEATKNIVKW